MKPSKVVENAMKAIESNESMQLDLVLGGKKLSRGEYISRAGAQSAPALHFPGAKSGQTYLMLNVDLDAPFISWSVLGPILHWLQAGLTVSSATEDGLAPLVAPAANEPHIVNYAPPGPPPGAAPHRYVFLLYEQPVGFEAARCAPNGVAIGGQTGIGPRIRFDVDAWIAKAGLGEPVAGSWFTSN